MHRAVGVMLALVANVRCDPLQIARAETDDAVSCLPLQRLVVHPVLLVDVVRRPALEPTDPLADLDRRRDRDGHMNMVVGPADFVNERAGGVDDSFFQEPMGQGFNRGRE